MWIAVTNRFTTFDTNIRLTKDQVEDGVGKCQRITKTLNKAYYDSDSETENLFIVGSWGKGTACQRPYDVDMLFVLPAHVYHRFEGYSGNKQSALLQEVKGHIASTYTQTEMRGDGQVVQVNFNSILIEVVPAFALTGGGYYICDTNDGGKYTAINPQMEITNLNSADAMYNNNVRRFIRMVKIWRDFCNVPLDSYVLEALVVRFFQQYAYADKTIYWYDFFCGDFFEYLIRQAHLYVRTLDNGLHLLDDSWKSRAETAHERAKKACEFEFVDDVEKAGEEWQKIFDAWIPKKA